MDTISINESFCERILQFHQKNNNIKVLQVSKKLATAQGDNFLSEIYRIFVKYTNNEDGDITTNEETSLILKIKVPNTSVGEKSMDIVFQTETIIFKDILPKIEKFTDCSIAPKLFYADENSNYLAMEDLGRLGYTVGDRLKSLNLEQCHKVIEKLAKFHAGSVIISEKEPHLLKCFDSVCAYQILPSTFFKNLSGAIINLSKKISETFKEEEYQKIALKLEKFSVETEAKILDAVRHGKDEFCVLNHGDLWISNLMVQHDREENFCDARIVDFQLVSYTSPAIDLQQFLAMCVESELKGEKDEYFLDMYVTILTKTMEALGCKTKPPTKEQLKEAMRKRGIYSIITGLIFYPRIPAGIKDIDDFTNVCENNRPKQDVFKSPEAVQIIRKFSKIINDKGYLD